MDVIAAYEPVGTYREGRAQMCGTTHKTAKRIVTAHRAAQVGGVPTKRTARGHDYDQFPELVAKRVMETSIITGACWPGCTCSAGYWQRASKGIDAGQIEGEAR